MARRYCAVYKCNHSESKMKLWKDELCEEHKGLFHADCPCLQPYHFHRFPLKNKDLLRNWMKNINLQKFKPTVNSRVCSIHFVDGRPTEDNPIPQLHMGFNLKLTRPRRQIVKHPLPRKKNVQVGSMHRVQDRHNFQSPNSSCIQSFTMPGNWETVTIKQEHLCHMDSEEVGQASELFPDISADDPLNINSPDGTVTVKCKSILEELLQPKIEFDPELNSDLMDGSVAVKSEPILEELLLQPKIEFDPELNSDLMDGSVAVKCEPILNEIQLKNEVELNSNLLDDTVKFEPISDEEQLQPANVNETMEDGETPTIVNSEVWNSATQPSPHFFSSNAVCEEINNRAQHSTMGTQAFTSANDFRVEVTYKAKHQTDKKFQYYQCPQCCLFFNSLALLQEHMIGNSSEVKRNPNSELKCGFFCDVCNKRFAVVKALNMHHLIHNESFANINALNKNESEDESEVNCTLIPLKCGIKCTLCQQMLINQEELNKHMISHSQFKPFQCRKCEHKFGLETELKTHSKIHEVPKNSQGYLICKFCQKTFKVFQSIKKHMESAHNENVYKLYSITK